MLCVLSNVENKELAPNYQRRVKFSLKPSQVSLEFNEHGRVEENGELGVKILGLGSHSVSASKHHLASLSLCFFTYKMRPGLDLSGTLGL